MLTQKDAVRHAHALKRALGPKAEAEAAQRAAERKIAGHREAAKDWERVRAVIRMASGPRET
jgi:hypothetical protein